MFQRFFQYKTGLRHTAFKSVYHQQHAVYHFHDTFYFTAKVSMARGVHNINFIIAIMDGCIFSQNGDSFFSFQIVRVHNPFGNLFVFTEGTGLTQKLIYQGCLTMVYVGNNCYISNMILLHSSLLNILSQNCVQNILSLFLPEYKSFLQKILYNFCKIHKKISFNQKN